MQSKALFPSNSNTLSRHRKRANLSLDSPRHDNNVSSSNSLLVGSETRRPKQWCPTFNTAHTSVHSEITSSERTRDTLTLLVFHHFYQQLIAILPMDDSDFRRKLYRLRLDPSDVLTIYKLETSIPRKAKAKYFLDDVIMPSVTSMDGQSFYGLIKVMGDSDSVNLKDLAKLIKRSLAGEDVNPENEFSKYLAEAKKKKMVVKFQHTKVLLSGSAGAGKSSFCRLLFRRKYSSEYNSTDIMKTEQGVMGSRIGNVEVKQDMAVGKKTDHKALTVRRCSMLKQKDQVKWLELSPKNQLKQLKSLLKSQMFHPSNLATNQCTEDSASDHNIPTKFRTKIEKNIINSTALPDNLRIDETLKFVTVFDTGGQPEYVALLPAVNCMPTVNFLVHNLTKKLEDPVLVCYKQEGCKEAQNYFLNYSNLDMIQLLMCFVTDSLHQTCKEMPCCISVPEKPYLGFIGTHYDKIKSDRKVLQKVEEQLSSVIKERNGEFTVLLPESGVIFPVDNTTAGNAATEDPEVKAIRDQVEELTNEMDIKELPINWMILELEIQELHASSNKHYVTYEEYKKIAQENAWIIDEKEVKTSLWYFHVLGIVLHFSDPELSDWVIIDLHWLLTKLAKIMHLSSKDVKFPTHEFKERFDNQRLLAKKVLKKIRLEDIKQQEILFCIKVLVHLKVIASVTIEKVEYYYLPCALPHTMQYNDGCIFLLSEPLLIQFSSGYLPRGFFCSLVALLLKELPSQWEHQLGSTTTTTKHYSNAITFQLPDETFLHLHDKTYYLEVQVRHYKKDANFQYHSEIIPILREYLEMVCDQLRFDSNKLQYGFLCHASFYVGDHIVVLKSTGDMLPSEVKCSKTPSHKTQLGDSHKIWFDKTIGESLKSNEVSVSKDPMAPKPAKIPRLDAAEDIPTQEATATLVEGAVVIHQIANKDATPEMRDLNRYVTKYAKDWRNIGLELGLQLGVLDNIEGNDQQVQKCLQKMLDRWLKSNLNATWKILEVALTNANRLQLGLDPVDDVYGPSNKLK